MGDSSSFRQLEGNIFFLCGVTVVTTSYMYFQWSNNIEITYLKPITPTEEECNDPSLFASHVREVVTAMFDA